MRIDAGGHSTRTLPPVRQAIRDCFKCSRSLLPMSPTPCKMPLARFRNGLPLDSPHPVRPMIHVEGLTKYYGDYPAIQGVSFDVERGQIVGFLGHNGAGKSTTMRILAGYITATSGSATIAGHDVFWDSIEVRRKIGYMPESCPLYHEMR